MLYNFRPLGNGIFLLEFQDRYDLAMHFVRVQEFYECPNDKFNGRLFDIWDYIEWYSKENGNKFTYPSDWAGFNIPGNALRALYFNGPDILPGHNKYDEFMRAIFGLIRSQVLDEDFYLIGAQIGDDETIKHEVAHGLWNLNAEYRDKQISNLQCGSVPKFLETIYKNLGGMGYIEDVFHDEAQAYFSTGMHKSVFKGIPKSKIDSVTWLRKTFEKFYDA